MAENQNGWIGVFFDGGLMIKGQPNPAMIGRVKRWIADGETVKVIAPRTLKQGEDDGDGGTRDPEGHIDQWCNRRFGQALEQTLSIDLDMKGLYGCKCHRPKITEGLND